VSGGDDSVDAEEALGASEVLEGVAAAIRGAPDANGALTRGSAASVLVGDEGEDEDDEEAGGAGGAARAEAGGNGAEATTRAGMVGAVAGAPAAIDVTGVGAGVAAAARGTPTSDVAAAGGAGRDSAVGAEVALVSERPIPRGGGGT
jgi:hypothetical protein